MSALSAIRPKIIAAALTSLALLVVTIGGIVAGVLSPVEALALQAVIPVIAGWLKKEAAEQESGGAVAPSVVAPPAPPAAPADLRGNPPETQPASAPGVPADG